MLAAIFLAIGFFIGFMANSKTTIIYEGPDYGNIAKFSGNAMERTASIMVPAVDENKTGLTTYLTVEIVPGKGRILANIDKMLFKEDTQNSFRIARNVAEEKTGIDLSDYDIVYTIKTDATEIEGPSAGAAITIATIAALTGRDVKKNVMITGAINHDGTIGPVSNVLEKAVAAGKMGIKTFLVPINQGTIDRYETKKYCEDVGSSKICQDEKIPSRTDIGKIAGLSVVEVVDIDDAMKYMMN